MSSDALDLLSTSQTKPRCTFGAPLVAIKVNGYGEIRQACCNHWECPRCGEIRAKQEYRRIVDGAEKIAEQHKLYFWTITCRGKECSLEEAEENYYVWTNRLLTASRAKCKRAGVYWAYTQVTERQKKTRHHPHSHLITTFLPSDALVKATRGDKVEYFSHWFAQANIRAELGEQCRLSLVENASAVSRYVAKYMFKDSMSETWPKKWKRVRYSENWPKLAELKPDLAITLLTPSDWKAAERERVEWVCETRTDFEIAFHRLANIRLRQANVHF